MNKLQWTNEAVSVLVSLMQKMSPRDARVTAEDIADGIQDDLGEDISTWPSPREAVLSEISYWD